MIIKWWKSIDEVYRHKKPTKITSSSQPLLLPTPIRNNAIYWTYRMFSFWTFSAWCFWRDPHVSSNSVSNNERQNRLDPCPVISQLGRAEIGMKFDRDEEIYRLTYIVSLGNQLHVAQDWESRPGCCDPRVTKLCRTTTENSIKFVYFLFSFCMRFVKELLALWHGNNRC